MLHGSRYQCRARRLQSSLPVTISILSRGSRLPTGSENSHSPLSCDLMGFSTGSSTGDLSVLTRTAGQPLIIPIRPEITHGLIVLRFQWVTFIISLQNACLPRNVPGCEPPSLYHVSGLALGECADMLTSWANTGSSSRRRPPRSPSCRLATLHLLSFVPIGCDLLDCWFGRWSSTDILVHRLESYRRGELRLGGRPC